MSPRIVPLEPPFDSETDTLLRRWMPPNAPYEPLALFRVLAQNRELMSRMLPLGAKLLGNQSSVLPSERELVINRVCAVCHCEYEWGVHVTAFGAQVGFDTEKLNATVTASADDPLWTERERLLLHLVEQLHRDNTVSDALFEQLSQHWSTEQILEWVVMIGWYHTIAFIANTSGIDNERWTQRFPK